MKKIIIDFTHEFYSTQDAIDYIIDNIDIDNNEDLYDDWLDDITPPYTIGYSEFYASRILKELDPIAYRCGFDDFINAEYENIEYWLDNEEDCILGFSVEYEEIEEDEE